MKNFDLNDAKVYVSTYKKYNEGSLNGGWLKLSDYSDKEECYDLPEFAKTYFDYEKFARDLFMCDYYYEKGFVFQR